MNETVESAATSSGWLVSSSSSSTPSQHQQNHPTPTPGSGVIQNFMPQPFKLRRH
ncbi:hypothetical protein HDU76_005297, partial [Blyttiomyces sp. JEL0837]